MPKGPSNSNDIILTGFLARCGGSESELNSNGESQDPTICLDLLKTMITTVLRTSAHLFTPGEANVLVSFLDLSDLNLSDRSIYRGETSSARLKNSAVLFADNSSPADGRIEVKSEENRMEANRLDSEDFCVAKKHDGLLLQGQLGQRWNGKANVAAGEDTRDMLRNLSRIDKDVYNILLCVHIAYFRSTHLPTEILPRPLRHILRRYPEYVCTRADKVWNDRATFFESTVNCLRAEARVDGILSGQAKTTTKGKRLGPIEDPDKLEAAIRKAKAAKKLFDQIFSEWETEWEMYWLRSLRRALDDSGPVSGLERLEPGYALTRAVHKSMKSLEILEERNRELATLELLLGQDDWGRLFRGRWHIRKTNLLAKGKSYRAAAILAAEAGLTDGAAGLICQQSLIKTLATLQQRFKVKDPLDIPEPAQVSKAILQATPTVFTTERKLLTYQQKKKKRRSAGHDATTENKACLWTGNDGNVGTIEQLVSQYYKPDFERVTTGGVLLTTLFTLLFWDIIFMPLPGAFETDFQTCPLDLCEDTFFSSRKDAIELRLSEIKRGFSTAFLRLHDEQHRDSNVVAVGVRWDLYSREDLVEGREGMSCIPSNTLATICQMFCENYVEACGGAPDVIAWDGEQKKYQLVHIQGPGYPNTQSKKAWRDVLANARETNQEICVVVELGKATKKVKDKEKTGLSKRPATSGSRPSDENDEPPTREIQGD
ncbi:hypothetical protein B0H14DRAFT_3156295 [Mycena olivaceomarginata]|nr:hypothetical protein B0H14DRAFT_3156295 [Mycena olivaceomarginata]